MIPALVDNVHPEGIHDCTMEEVDEVFGRFQRSDRRLRLTEKLRRFVEEVRRTSIAIAVVIDGSYVTGKAEPGDIDLVVVLRPDFDPTQELRPMEYNAQSKRMIKAHYGFDMIAAKEGSERYQRQIRFFTRVRENDPEQKTSQLWKGLLRIML